MSFRKTLKILISSFLILSQAYTQEKNKEYFEGYPQHSQIQWDLAMDALSNYSFLGDEQVLDVGCGDGKITAHASKFVPEGSILGIDTSSQMISFAKETFPESEYPNLFFIEEDGSHLTYLNRFDLVVSFCALHWMPNQCEALQGIFQSLKPNGTLIAVVPTLGDKDLFRLIQETMNSEKWAPYFITIQSKRQYNAQEYVEVLAEAGFPSSEIKTQYVQTIFNREGLTNWLAVAFRLFEHLTENEKKELLEDCLGLILSYYPEGPKGEICIRSCCIEIYAKKPWME